MKISVGELRKLIREELQHVVSLREIVGTDKPETPFMHWVNQDGKKIISSMMSTADRIDVVLKPKFSILVKHMSTGDKENAIEVAQGIDAILKKNMADPVKKDLVGQWRQALKIVIQKGTQVVKQERDKASTSKIHNMISQHVKPLAPKSNSSSSSVDWDQELSKK